MSETGWTIGFLLFPGLTQLDLTGPHEVLARKTRKWIQKKRFQA